DIPPPMLQLSSASYGSLQGRDRPLLSRREREYPDRPAVGHFGKFARPKSIRSGLHSPRIPAPSRHHRNVLEGGVEEVLEGELNLARNAVSVPEKAPKAGEAELATGAGKPARTGKDFLVEGLRTAMSAAGTADGSGLGGA